MRMVSTAILLGLVLAIVGGNTPATGQILVDSDFNGSSDSMVLRANSTGQDWYESRQDVPTLLTLNTTNVGGNATKKAKFSESSSGNAYLTQEFNPPQTQRFSVQWDIYVDSIVDRPDSTYDRAAWMFLGDDTGTDPTRIGPNAEDSERFVYLAFHKAGGGTSGTMDLVARESTFVTVATGLSLKRWYTIRVIVDLAADTYEVYVDGQFRDTVNARTPKSRLTHISFAQWPWSEGAATYYIDNVVAQSSSANSAQSCWQPGSRVVHPRLLDPGILPGFLYAEGGTGGTVLCADAEGNLLVSWDLWSDPRNEDTGAPCMGGSPPLYPEKSALWHSPSFVYCYLDACGTFHLTTAGDLIFTPDTSNIGAPAVEVDPDVLLNPSGPAAVTNGRRLRLRGLYNPDGSRWWNSGGGPCVDHPIISECGESIQSTCCQEGHIPLGDRVVFLGDGLYADLSQAGGRSGTVLSCSGNQVLVCWDLENTKTARDAAPCQGALPLYAPPGSLSCEECCYLGWPVDICGTIVDVILPAEKQCGPNVLLRADDTTYGHLCFFRSGSDLQIGDHVRVRALWRSQLGNCLYKSTLLMCPPRYDVRATWPENEMIFHPIISRDCGDGDDTGACLPDLVPYLNAVWTFTPQTIDLCTSGASLSFTYGMKNQGCSASGPFSVCFYASTDATITSSDHLLGTIPKNSFAPGESGTWITAPFQLDRGELASGTYYLGFIVDCQNQVPESSETNNVAVMSQRLTVVSCGGGSCQVDLYDRGESYRSFTPQVLYAGRSGQQITMYFTVANGGTQTSPESKIRFYASTDTNITTSDYMIGHEGTLPSLAPGTSIDCYAPRDFPTTIPAGTYYVGWIIDPFNAICETNEDNNTAYKVAYRLTVLGGPM